MHPPVDVLESLIACTKAGKAHTLLAEWRIAQEVCQERWGVELKTLIHAVGRRSGAVLDVDDRARQSWGRSNHRVCGSLFVGPTR